VACSVYSALSCDFYAFAKQLSPPFETGTTSIGIFHYATSSDYVTCIVYDEQFWRSPFNGFFWTAQFAAIVAPCLGILAMTLNLVEVVFVRFRGSFLVPVVFYLLACLIQCCTFMIYGEINFWYDKTRVLPIHPCSYKLIDYLLRLFFFVVTVSVTTSSNVD
jgi:hypothetical protein